MKRIIIYILTTGMPNQANSQTFVPNEILQNVFHIKFDSRTASCFRISYDSSDCLVTARHLFPSSLPNNSRIEIETFGNGKWLKQQVTLLLHINTSIDIAVLKLDTNNQKQNLFEIDSKGFYLSQECFFLGYPFGLMMDDKDSKFNSGFPVPFVKRGIISSFTPGPTDMMLIYIDGINNPGFSGGPVVVSNRDGTGKMKCIGVVSAYINENKVVKTPIGDFINSQNSGIIVSYASDHIFEVLKRK